MSSYYANTTITLRAEYTHDAVLVDATTPSFCVVRPDGGKTTYTSPDVQHDGVGLYSLAVTVNAIGAWRYSFDSGDSYQSGTFTVVDRST